MMWGDHWMFGGFMWIFWILIIIGLFFLVKWLVEQSRSNQTRQDESSLEILRKRYAKGEINKEEFEQKKKDLMA
ncbi:MAG TPA: SHOCT domain-containing protein [candidate division Zixibacteria bacterium]